MKTVRAYPPIWNEIRKVFPAVVSAKNVIYCWGNTIYNPDGNAIPPQLIAHEQVHSNRQGSNPQAWWELYLEDVGFRFDEEVPAHREEYRYLVEHGCNRQVRRSALKLLAKRLASPLYGSMISVPEARIAIAGSDE